MSPSWTGALDQATRALAAGRAVAAVGEPGTGRATLLGQALRQAHPRARILCAAAPPAEDVDAWLSLWTPELAKPETAVIVENAHTLPAWAGQALHQRATEALRSLPLSADGNPAALIWAVTAGDLSAVPQPLSALLETVVPVPALRERSGDILPLARYAARQTRLREVDISHAAERILTGHDWPGNIDELFSVIHSAALRTETIDVQHLPASLQGRSGAQLSRLEAVERDEIVRCLSRPGITVGMAAAELGLSRATIYRRISRLGISLPR